jgi:hypothetical protein
LFWGVYSGTYTEEFGWDARGPSCDMPDAVLIRDEDVRVGDAVGSANFLRTSLRLWGLLGSVRLLSRTDQDLVDAYPLRLADGVGYGVRDVLGLERLYVPLLQPLADFLVGDVVG